jgi:hypothetical protein
MRTLGLLAVVLTVLLMGLWTVAAGIMPTSRGNDRNIQILDDCDPADPAWSPTGGCSLKPHEGDVTNQEFGALLSSPLGLGGILIGHPSWRNSPSYLSTERGKSVRIENLGGRTHTFTNVANFGGGRVPPLNGSGTLAIAPECVPPLAVDLAPGDSVELKDLSEGLHLYQCCIHPWMRAAIRVGPKQNGK